MSTREVYAEMHTITQFPGWFEPQISFDQSDHLEHIPHPGKAALVLDPIIEGCYLNMVLMDDDNSVNLPYLDR